MTQPAYAAPPQSASAAATTPNAAQHVARSASSVLPAAHHAIRVAVWLADGSSDLRVRMLAQGEAAPPGTSVAVLVGLEPGASLWGTPA